MFIASTCIDSYWVEQQWLGSNREPMDVEMNHGSVQTHCLSIQVLSIITHPLALPIHSRRAVTKRRDFSEWARIRHINEHLIACDGLQEI